MSSSDSASEEEAAATLPLYNFSLVQFVHRGKKKKIEDIDIVPSKWLKYDYSRGRCTTKYAPAGSNQEDYQVLQGMVRTLADAPQSYTTYSVDLKGRAETYQEALQKLEKLQEQNNVFTLESEQSASEVQKLMENSVKQQNLQQEAEKLKAMMDNEADAEDDDQPVAPKRKKKNREKPASTSSKGTLHSPVGNEPLVASSSVNIGAASSRALFNTPTEPIVVASTPPDAHVQQIQAEVVATLDLPVIDWQNVKCSTPFESAAITQLIRLTNIVENMQAQQEKMGNFILDKRVVNVMNNQIDFNLKYGYETPFSTKEKFNQFNGDLKVNKFLRNDTCYELMQHIDKNYVITRSYVSIMKRFLTKGLATQFTAMRASKTDRSKEQFRGNELSKCMETVIVGSRAEKGLPTELKDIISGLSDVLCNAKKWN